MASKLTKKPENKTIGTDDTGPMNTPVWKKFFLLNFGKTIKNIDDIIYKWSVTSTLIADPITKPIDWETNAVNIHIVKYIMNLFVSNGCDVMKYTIMTYAIEYTICNENNELKCIKNLNEYTLKACKSKQKY